jgi:hypothetical protein
MEPQRTPYGRDRFELRPGRASGGPRAAFESDLRECPCCGSDLVQLVEASPPEDGGRHVERRCPECDWEGAGRFTRQAVLRYEQEQEAAREDLRDLLRGVERARIEREVAHFARSLARDEVLPEDF